MNSARAELGPRVSNFVLQLDRAGRQSEGGYYAGALVAFVAWV